MSRDQEAPRLERGEVWFMKSLPSTIRSRAMLGSLDRNRRNMLASLQSRRLVSVKLEDGGAATVMLTDAGRAALDANR
jgi:hypothetical protein